MEEFRGDLVESLSRWAGVPRQKIVLNAPPPRVVPPLKLKVEQGQAVRADDLPLLAKRIQTKMHESLRITPIIEWLTYGALERATHKATLFERSYEQSETSRD